MRPPSSAWVSAIPSLGRNGVAETILGSSEYRFNLFTSYYNRLLHRGVDGGLSAWVTYAPNAYSARVLFEASAEFQSNG